jgi:hypothetical protein
MVRGIFVKTIFSGVPKVSIRQYRGSGARREGRWLAWVPSSYSCPRARQRTHGLRSRLAAGGDLPRSVCRELPPGDITARALDLPAPSAATATTVCQPHRPQTCACTMASGVG